MVHYFVNKEKYCQIYTCPVWLYFALLDCAHFAIRLKSANYKSHWNILVIYDQWKIMSDLNMSDGKASDFVSIPLFGKNSDFESHWNPEIYFD